MNNSENKIDIEKILVGIFAFIAIVAAIISTVTGGIDTSTVWGCIKDVAGSITDVILLFAIFKTLKPKKAGDFNGVFDEELKNLYNKYDLIFCADNTEKGKEICRHNIASKLDGMVTKDTGKMIRFFDFYHQKSTVEFFVQVTNFAERTNEVAKDIVSMLEKRLNGVAEIKPKYSQQTSINVEFKEPLINSEDALKVAKVIDDVIFFYIMEYKKR